MREADLIYEGATETVSTLWTGFITFIIIIIIINSAISYQKQFDKTTSTYLSYKGE